MLIDELLFLSDYECQYCGSDLIKGEGLCMDCYSSLDRVDRKASLEAYDFTYTYPFFYNSFAKKIISQFKFNHGANLAKVLAFYMVETLIKNSMDKNLDYVSYVPLYHRVEKRRGYNQAQILAEEISKKLELPLVECFIKVKNTKEQNKISPKLRYNNLLSSKVLKESVDLKNKNILIVDDIITTGATMKSILDLLDESTQARGVFLMSGQKITGQ